MAKPESGASDSPSRQGSRPEAQSHPTMEVCLVVGARPNFVKAAPVHRALSGGALQPVLVHTGQHYDRNLSDLFFEDLGLPEPDIHLRVGAGSHAEQTAAVMLRFEEVLRARPFAAVVVFGDINSTVAASLTAAKLGIPVVHVESGLRSGDRSMPEELNRLVTDTLSDLLFTTEESGNQNLRREGVPEHKVRFVGNTMVDSLLHSLPRARQRQASLLAELGLDPESYGVLTLHRPSNVDQAADLNRLLVTLGELASELPLIFPVHPRTRLRLSDLQVDLPSSVRTVDPLGYLDFLALMDGARLLLTDSGGIQEESTALRVPCLTLRHNTERPITLSAGSNRLVGTDPATILAAAREALSSSPEQRDDQTMPPLWDGHAAKRIATELESFLLG